MADIVGTGGPDNLVGTAGDDTVTGLGGNDTINDGTPGTADVDTLDGGDGDDFITINDARDTVIGGNGFDTLFFGFPPGPGGLEINLFQLWATGSMNFGTGSISGIERVGPTVSGTMDNDTIILGSNYFYDTTLLGQEGNDVLIGGSGNDDLRGFTGTDYLVGGFGNDILDGGLGNTNTLQGGAGDDTYNVFVAGDSIVEFADEGYDRVNTQLSVFFLSANVEDLRFTNSNPVVGIGNAGNNAIYGSAGADELFGLDGNDNLFGSDPFAIAHGPANTLLGGLGDDIYHVYSVGDSTVELPDQGTDTVAAYTASHVLQSNVENLYSALSGPFVGIGNELNNGISGGSGADFLSGGAGNDYLSGGSGAANTLLGGIGDDYYSVSNAGDTIIENAGEGFDIVLTHLPLLRMAPNVELMRFQGSGYFTGLGSAGDDRIEIKDGFGYGSLFGLEGNDQLEGGIAGLNELVGGVGNDDYVLRFAGDSVVEYANEGIDRVIIFDDRNITAYTLPNNVENLFISAPVAVTAIGNNLNNDIVAVFSTDDSLFGRDGDDSLNGQGGNDTYFGGNGNDTIYVGDGADRVFFEGTETGIDLIWGFTSGEDKVFLSRAGFGASTTVNFVSGTGTMVAPDGNTTLFFDTSTRTLSIDMDGNGNGAPIAITQFNSFLTTLVSTDIVFY